MPEAAQLASSKSFADPIHDGATDPTVIQHRGTGEWWLFYTQRRARAEEEGVAWVHGSAIGVAVLQPGGDWLYRGTVEGLDEGGNTHWAPEIIWDGQRYRMYLTVIEGVPTQWAGHARAIVEYQSDDLERWTRIGPITLSSDRVIDAAVERCGDGLWRLWYKDEADESTTWAASSPDLERWSVEGQVIGGRPHEGPNVFVLHGWWWLIVDEWRGQGVYRSDDGVRWQRQARNDGLILDAPGSRPEDATAGRHADVVVVDGAATVFYFTHPWWDGTELGSASGATARKSTVHAAPLSVVDGELWCDRDSFMSLNSAVSSRMSGQ